MLDRNFIGYEFNSSEMTIPRWKITQFANAIREKNPIYYDLKAARAQGYKDLPVPPTFFTRMMYSGEKNFYATLGIDFKNLLDGGKEFRYHSQCVAGDTIIYQTRVENIIEKEGKRGKMDIVTAITRGKNKESNEKVFDVTNTLIVFH
ncbi:MAG: MaoC family dehydratase N-terminal domain-containing protein [Candidatus Lokiarchaeota archaeon]|nr:MaoC family dehydratase N-terminal domain-containing protein [Candidatus Lokiarchaeota archaeon]